MSKMTADTGIADLLLIYSVKSLLVEFRPDLERLIVVDPHRPRLSFPTPRGEIVVEKSTTTPDGTWDVSGLGRSIVAPGARPWELTALARGLLQGGGMYSAAAA